MAKLYDLAPGTSSGSRYVVIGIASHLALSCRIKSGAFSIRVDTLHGENIPSTAVEKLVQLGFQEKSKGSYMSLHLGYESDIDALKVLGALWFSVDGYFPFSTKRPDFWKLKNKGS